jgi:tetratricopeptide (TPR) repeat protein
MPVVVLTVLMLIAASTAGAQVSAVNPEAYGNAVDAYSSGRRITESIAELQPWARKDFEAAVDRLILTRDLHRIEMAAIFQLEISIGVMSVSPAGAEIHLDLGEKLLKGLASTGDEPRDTPQRIAELRQLSSVWLGVASSTYLSVTDTRRARPWLQKALDLAPRAAPLKIIQGAIEEIDAIAFSPERYLTLTQKSRASQERNRRWSIAEGFFRDAIEADPAYAKGHIRLGRVQFLLGKIPQARHETGRGLALAKIPGDQYLAALFLGAVKEQQKDAAGAREQYERALTISPQSQTAMTALAYLDLIAGRPDRAQALARSFAAAPANDPTWWSYKNGGLDDEGLAWIRARVKR